MAKWTIRTVRGRRRYFRDGKPVTKKAFDKAFPSKPIGPPMVAAPATWQDFTSIGLSVHPDQVAEATARNKKHGIRVTYDEDGTARIPDRNQRAKIMKLEGMHDQEGGYGD